MTKWERREKVRSWDRLMANWIYRMGQIDRQLAIQYGNRLIVDWQYRMGTE